MIKKYTAIDHDGEIKETMKARAEITGVIMDLQMPLNAVLLLIGEEVISGVFTRYHQ